MPCSEECIRGTIHKGDPKGNEEQVHGLNAYVVGNRTNPRGIVVVYSDIFGLPLINNKLIADAYAKSGEYLVYLPDFFEGDPVPLKTADVLLPVDAAKQSTLEKYGGMLARGPSFFVWMTRHKHEPTEKVCMDFLASLRHATPVTQKIGMVGFCWGGRYALRAGLGSHSIEKGGEKVSLVDAVVAFHPSNLVLPDDVQNPIVPMTFAWGVEDQGVSFAQKGKVENIHAEAKRNGRVVPEIEHQVYTPGRHGFAVRGNPEDTQERAALEESVTQALTWLRRWL